MSKELLDELKIKFSETKTRLGFKSSYEEINSICYIEDMILEHKFVSNQFSRQICNRLVETYYSWINQLHTWIYPSPTDVISMSEVKTISNDEKKEIFDLIGKIMYLLRKNKRIAFENIKKSEEGAFIDELVEFNGQFSSLMLKFHKKFEKLWKDEVKK